MTNPTISQINAAILTLSHAGLIKPAQAVSLARKAEKLKLKAAKLARQNEVNARVSEALADILKEDQAQNTCIFSTEFALRMMGDIQEFFTGNGVRNFYSVSISGYHIAEAGANPITQVAFTLANGFTIIEYYLSLIHI